MSAPLRPDQQRPRGEDNERGPACLHRAPDGHHCCARGCQQLYWQEGATRWASQTDKVMVNSLRLTRLNMFYYRTALFW